MEGVRPRRLRVLLFISSSFAVLGGGVWAAAAVGGYLEVPFVVAGFAGYVYLFGRAVRELGFEGLAWKIQPSFDPHLAPNGTHKEGVGTVEDRPLLGPG